MKSRIRFAFDEEASPGVDFLKLRKMRVEFMRREAQVPSEVLVLIVGTGVATTARAMTLSFVAITLQQTFDIGPAMIGFLLGLGSLMGAIAAPLAGALSDKVGRKMVLTAVMVTLAVAMIALAVAEDVLLFCAAQSLAAIAVSILGPISRALISDICLGPLRLKCFSWRHMASNIGWAIGPLIGLSAGVVSASLFMMAAGIYAALAFTFQSMNLAPTIDDTEPLPVNVTSTIGGVRTALNDPRLLYFAGGGALLLAVYGQWMATLAPYLASRFPDGADIFAYVLSTNGVVVVIGNPFARRFIERVGPKPALVVGCLLLVLSQFGFLTSVDITGFVVSTVVFTAGEILIMSSEYSLVDRISTPRNRGIYFGIHSVSAIGSFIGPTTGGIALETMGGAAMFLLFAGFALIGMLLFIIGASLR